MSTVPETQLLLRGKEGIEIWNGENASSLKHVKQQDDNEDSPLLNNADLCEYSSDGQYLLAIHREIGFYVQNTITGNVIVEIQHPGIQAVSMSPKGNYFCTWERPLKEENVGNLIVWSTLTGSILVRYNQKKYTRQSWPAVQWSADEAIAARMVSNEVHVYKGADMAAGILSKIMQTGVSGFSVAPGQAPYHLSAFTGEKNGRPANVKIYAFPNLKTPTASKSFFKAQEVNMKWSPHGNGLVVETSTDLDTSGKSYYGETGLYFMQCDGEYDCIIPMTKEGQVHDVQWDPTGKGFIVLCGSMPCHATLYDNRAEPVFEFGAAPRNHISWSPHGRFVAIAGFGNLRGDIDFWDRNKLIKIGSCTSNAATTHCWSPDSRFFATATTFPRLRVDNGYKVFTYCGQGPVATGDRKELYEMRFRPASVGVFPNRPASPKSSTIAVVETKPKSAPYRPPGSSGNFAAMMRREEGGSKKLNASDKSAYRATASSSSTYGVAPVRRIPGMAPEVEDHKAKSRAAKKKKNKEDSEKKAAALAATQALLGGESDLSLVAVEVVEEVEVVAVLTEEEKAKKVKGLNKKLKQVEVLKLKVSQEGKGSLNADQLAKLSAEESIREDIAKYSN